MSQGRRHFQKESGRPSQLNQYLARLLRVARWHDVSLSKLFAVASLLAQSTKHFRDGIFDAEPVLFTQN